ncbi:MAG: c-type cytochrome [Kangiellaceae bacterium]|jgi:cytochrome c553|nr:c-type cytochrome [Kangiellaceae bacterium]
MKNLAKSFLLVSALSFSAVTFSAPAKEAACRACHGENGAKPLLDNYPKLAGQNKGYLVEVLKAYRSGERKGGQSMIMTAQASALSDADIEELATFYAAAK